MATAATAAAGKKPKACVVCGLLQYVCDVCQGGCTCSPGNVERYEVAFIGTGVSGLRGLLQFLALLSGGC